MTAATSGTAQPSAPVSRMFGAPQGERARNGGSRSNAGARDTGAGSSRSADSSAPPPPPPVTPAGTRPPSANGLAGRKRLWWTSVLVSIGLHALVVGAFLIDWHFPRHNEEAPPASMVVDLAVMPSAPPVPPSEIPPGPEQVQAAPRETPTDALDFDPPPRVDAAVRPDFALPVRQQARPVETTVAAQEARETTAPQAVQAPVRDNNAAPMEGNVTAPPSDAEQAWEGRLVARLERNKRYPAAAQAAGQEDTVFLRLVLDRSGRLLEASIRRSRGFTLLDNETLALARRAGPYPQPPASVIGDRIVRVVPVDFYLGRRH